MDSRISFSAVRYGISGINKLSLLWDCGLQDSRVTRSGFAWGNAGAAVHSRLPTQLKVVSLRKQAIVDLRTFAALMCSALVMLVALLMPASTVHAQALPFDELQVACAPAVVKSGPVHGCALYQNINGDVFTDIYWLEGSFCAMIHEWCHAANFGGHTTEFITRLRAGDQNPACPRGEVE
jgi:hypothetical protein